MKGIIRIGVSIENRKERRASVVEDPEELPSLRLENDVFSDDYGKFVARGCLWLTFLRLAGRGWRGSGEAVLARLGGSLASPFSYADAAISITQDMMTKG